VPSNISVLIPAYNRAAVIGAAIESALAQQVDVADSFEIVVVDDASTDDLRGALGPFWDRLRLIRHERNEGAAAARNTAVAAASGEYLAFLDSDDIWLPGKLARQIAAMREHGWEASCTAYLLARPGIGEFVSPNYSTGPLGLDQIAWGCFVSPGSTLMCRKSLFTDIGPFDTSLKRLEDWDWLLRLVRTRPLGFLAEPLGRVAPAPGAGIAKVLPALGILWDKHASALAMPNRRHFASALDVERAAAFYRGGDWFGTATSLLKSLARAPIGNAAIGAVWHNLRTR
jgi:glycosyltransferase involved in cell wall biosynthesis